MIRIIIADDHGIVRSGIRALLQHASDITIVAEAKNGEEAVRLTQGLKPDVVLMDLNMPGTDGFTASMQLLNSATPAKILIVSTQEDEILPARLLHIGVCGYLTKRDTPKALVKAIRCIYAGENYFHVPHANISDAPDSPFKVLSDREFQIALMVARGMESQEIADRLFLSKKTIHGYHRDLLKKLGMVSNVDLVHLVIKYGLIDLDSVVSAHEETY